MYCIKHKCLCHGITYLYLYLTYNVLAHIIYEFDQCFYITLFICFVYSAFRFGSNLFVNRSATNIYLDNILVNQARGNVMYECREMRFLMRGTYDYDMEAEKIVQFTCSCYFFTYKSK